MELGQGPFTCVRLHVTTCDPVRQTMLHSSVMGFLWKGIHILISSSYLTSWKPELLLMQKRNVNRAVSELQYCGCSNLLALHGAVRSDVCFVELMRSMTDGHRTPSRWNARQRQPKINLEKYLWVAQAVLLYTGCPSR